MIVIGIEICSVQLSSLSARRILPGMGKFELGRLTINSQLCEQNLRKVVKVKIKVLIFNYLLPHNSTQ